MCIYVSVSGGSACHNLLDTLMNLHKRAYAKTQTIHSECHIEVISFIDPFT